VVFLTVFSFVSTPAFFLTIAGCIALAAMATLFLDEPKSSMFEVMPDGRVHMVEMH
jgi:NNP family nitrate/nitrite transporter-like MFS transporter